MARKVLLAAPRGYCAGGARAVGAVVRALGGQGPPGCARTCPVVRRPPLGAPPFAAHDRTILLIGHAGHEEVVGTTGQAPERTILVQDVEEARAVEASGPPTPSHLTRP